MNTERQSRSQSSAGLQRDLELGHSARRRRAGISAQGNRPGKTVVQCQRALQGREQWHHPQRQRSSSAIFETCGTKDLRPCRAQDHNEAGLPSPDSESGWAGMLRAFSALKRPSAHTRPARMTPARSNPNGVVQQSPGLARRQPWVIARQSPSTPTGLRPGGRKTSSLRSPPAATPLGLRAPPSPLPRVVPAVQPWASLHNRVAVEAAHHLCSQPLSVTQMHSGTALTTPAAAPSDFGLRISFGFRPSDFGFPAPPV